MTPYPQIINIGVDKLILSTRDTISYTNLSKSSLNINKDPNNQFYRDSIILTYPTYTIAIYLDCLKQRGLNSIIFNPQKILSFSKLIDIINQTNIDTCNITRTDRAIDIESPSLCTFAQMVYIKNKHLMNLYLDSDLLNARFQQSKEYKSGLLSGIYAGHEYDQLLLYDKLKEQKQKNKSYLPSRIISPNHTVIRIERRTRYEDNELNRDISIISLPKQLKSLFRKKNMFDIIEITPFILQPPKSKSLSEWDKYGYFRGLLQCYGLKLTKQILNRETNKNFKDMYSSFIKELGDKMPLNDFFYEAMQAYTKT